MKNFTISGVDHIIRMLNQYPQMSGLSSLAPIFEIGKKAKLAVAKSGCGCSAGPIYAANKHVFERALGAMSNGDHMIVKTILKVDKICYYVTDMTGKRMLKCM